MWTYFIKTLAFFPLNSSEWNIWIKIVTWYFWNAFPHELVWHEVVTVALELSREAVIVISPSTDVRGRDSLSWIYLKPSINFLHSLYIDDKGRKAQVPSVINLSLILVNVARNWLVFHSCFPMPWLICTRWMHMLCSVYFSLISGYLLYFITMIHRHIACSIVCDEMFTIFISILLSVSS